MENRPALNREFLIPILIGGISVLGIVAVLIIGSVLSAAPEIVATPSETPFKYVYLGTEPAFTTLMPEGSDIASATEAPTEASTSPFIIPPVIITPTRFAINTPTFIVLPGISRTATGSVPRTSTPTRTSTVASVNTYDDTDSRLQYNGNWVAQSGLIGPYQGTLHISSTAGDSVMFSFTGQEIHFFYQAGASLGIVTISFDADTLAFSIDEAHGTGEWVYTFDTIGLHTVTITHNSGGSVNVDRLTIPITATPTPTRTPKP